MKSLDPTIRYDYLRAELEIPVGEAKEISWEEAVAHVVEAQKAAELRRTSRPADERSGLTPFVPEWKLI